MPQINPIIFDDGTQLHMWRVTESLEEFCKMCKLQGIDVEPCRTFKSDTRRVEYMAVRVLLNAMFMQNVELHHNDSGAPYLDNGVNISISHTKGLIGIAKNNSKIIGIDMEHNSPRVMRVRSKFLDNGEQQAIAPDEIMANLVAWTAKEAMYKVVSQCGVSLRDDLHLEQFDKEAAIHDKAEYEGYSDYNGNELRMRLISCALENWMITYATPKL